MEVAQTDLTQEGQNRKKNSIKRKGRKESKDSAISDVSPKVTISRETSIDSGAGVDEEDDNNTPLGKENGKDKNSKSEDKTKKKSKFRRHGSESVIVVNREMGDGDQAKKISSMKKTIRTDSALSTPSVASMSVLSPYAESRHLSSPSASDRSANSPSTPRRSNSPELSKALRVRQERLQLELALAETRSKLKQHHIGEKPLGAEVDSKNTRLSKKVLQRAKSLELSKLKYAEKTSLLNGKPGSHSLETIKALEETYSKQRHRSHSQKRYVVSLGQDNTNFPNVGNGKTHTDVVRGDRDSVDSISMETARTSAVILNVSDSLLERNTVLPPLEELQDSTSSRPSAGACKGNRKSEPNRDDSASVFVSQHSRESNIPEAGRINTLTTEVENKTLTTLNSILNDALPPIPCTEDSQESAVLDWRPVFRAEMIRLRKEVNDFRQFCAKQVKENAFLVQNSWNTQSEGSSSQLKNGILLTAPPKLTDQLEDVEVNLHLLQRRQQLLDLEAELCSREKHLSEKQKNLEDYEKEIKEVESLLNQRQTICDRRQRALSSLDEELQQLRQEMEQARDQIHKDGTIPESNTERARKNWDTVRRNLLDRQHLLETTVQKYRSELATASSSIAGKDILITRLQNTIVDFQDEMANKDKRIKQLEAKLGLAISEARNLSEQLSSNSHRDVLGSSNYNRSDHFFPRRASQELTPDQSRSSFRGSMYRRPSTNAGSDHAEDHPKPVITAALDHDSEQFRNNSRLLGKRSSISDNAITRLTLSTLKTDDKYGRGSSACVLQ